MPRPSKRPRKGSPHTAPRPKRAALTLSLPRSLTAELDRVAHRNFTSRNALINHAVRALVATLQQQRED